MSYPHSTPMSGSALISSPRGQTGSRLRATPANAVQAQAALRPSRSAPLTRRFETMWLENGLVQSATRLAPATPLFEEAFSAFARGAVLQTAEGRVAVEDLLPGMRVITGAGEAVAVTWIGAMVIYPSSEAPVTLTRFTADALGHGRPAQDLVLGGRARLLLRDPRARQFTGEESAFVPARAYVDGVSVIELMPASPVMAYHLALERHGSLRVGGLEVEAYHPGEGVEMMLEPRMLSLFKDFFPHVRGLGGFGPMAHQRLTRFEVDQLIG